MAHAAIRELRGMHGIFADQFFAERELIGRRPIQIENFVTRTDEFFGRATTFEAPFHVKRAIST